MKTEMIDCREANIICSLLFRGSSLAARNYAECFPPGTELRIPSPGEYLELAIAVCVSGTTLAT